MARRLMPNSGAGPALVFGAALVAAVLFSLVDGEVESPVEQAEEGEPAPTGKVGPRTFGPPDDSSLPLGKTSDVGRNGSIDSPPTVFVDVAAGDGGDGSATAPLRTLADGLQAVGAGQTLVVAGGEYREQIVLGPELAAGSADRPIVVSAAEGERVVVRGSLRLKDLRHWSIRGINVTWDDENDESLSHMVQLIDGSDWEYRDSEIWGARAYSGVLVGGEPGNWALRGLYIHDTFPTNGTNQDHLIYCACGSGGGVIERNLLVGSENGRAIKLGTVDDSDPRVANVVVRHNTMVDNRGPSNVQLSYRTSDIIVERNIFVGAGDGEHNVTAYRLDGDNNRVRDNIGWASVGVVEDDPGLIDDGGNHHRDPQLDRGYAPRDDESREYGDLAP